MQIKRESTEIFRTTDFDREKNCVLREKYKVEIQ